MKLNNDLLLRAARGEAVERPPVWLMRQAGRILPQYRRVRKEAGSFKNLVSNPDLVTEVTIQPVDELGVDAAILFSDILVVPEAMGLPYEMIEKKGPHFSKTIRNSQELKKLHVADMDSLNFVFEGIKKTNENLNNRVPLIGFAGAPWTLFAYMTEGEGSKTFSVARKLLYRDAEFAHTLLEMITEGTIRYLKEQIRAGVHLVQIFDSWAGLLPSELYEEFGFEYISRICDEIYEVPVTVFAKGAYNSLDALGTLNCQVVSLDWTMDIEESRNLIGKRKTLQGNLDPCVLYAGEPTIRNTTQKMLNAFGPQHYIANLGHGVYPDTPLDGVKCFVNAVKGEG